MVTNTSKGRYGDQGYGFQRVGRGIEDPMNTAVVETEEEDNTSNVAAGVRAAAMGRNEGIWGRRQRKAQQDGLREAWHPSTLATRGQVARAAKRSTGGACTREKLAARKGRRELANCGAAASRGHKPPHDAGMGISHGSFLFFLLA